MGRRGSSRPCAESQRSAGEAADRWGRPHLAPLTTPVARALRRFRNGTRPLFHSATTVSTRCRKVGSRTRTRAFLCTFLRRPPTNTHAGAGLPVPGSGRRYGAQVSSRFLGLELVACVIAVVTAVGCGNSPSGATVGEQGRAGSPSRPEPPDFVGDNDAGGGNLGCQRATCAELGKNCGPVADGCGGTLDCGTCAADGACGLVSPSVCTAFIDLCVPATAADACAGKACGTEGDGCGGSIDCGSCPDGQACGLVQAFQCGEGLTGSTEQCPARIDSCAEVGAECGLIGNGCGGTLECGGCGGGQLCGIESPQKCGRAPVCEPLAPAAACAGKC